MLFDVPKNIAGKKRKGCGKVVYWILTKNKKRMPG